VKSHDSSKGHKLEHRLYGALVHGLLTKVGVLKSFIQSTYVVSTIVAEDVGLCALFVDIHAH
jgi:hypothetical protein